MSRFIAPARAGLNSIQSRLLSRRLWLLILALAYGLLSLLRAPADHVPLGAPRQVETSKPQVCVHTLLENEVEEWKIKRSLELTRELGAGTITQFFPWAYVERQKGQYSWEQTDRIIRHARNQGLRIIARMGLVPGWARPAEHSTLNHLPEASFDDFANFAAAFASRYIDQVDHFIIWNEPNLSFEWGYRPVDAAAYARLLRAVYPRVKDANPRAVVLAGALAPTNEMRGSPAGLNEMDYLREMYRHGAADYFDALALHTYGFRHLPEAEPAADSLNFRRVELLREIMVAHGDGEKRAFISEFGWNDHPRWASAVRPSQRLAYTIRAFEYAAEHWHWVERLCLWALRYPAATQRYPDYFTLISPDFDLKPIYYAVQDYARGWQRNLTRWLPPPLATR